MANVLRAIVWSENRIDDDGLVILTKADFQLHQIDENIFNDVTFALRFFKILEINICKKSRF